MSSLCNVPSPTLAILGPTFYEALRSSMPSIYIAFCNVKAPSSYTTQVKLQFDVR